MNGLTLSEKIGYFCYMMKMVNIVKTAAKKKIMVSSALIISGLFTFATVGIGIGGEGKKAVKSTHVKGFTPIKTVNGFTLKAGPQYKGSMIMNQSESRQDIRFKSVVTYQKGNTTYILPLNHQVQKLQKSNLEALQLKVSMRK